MLPEGGAQVDLTVEGTGAPSVCEELRRMGGLVGKSPTKEQASLVLWLYCSRSLNLLNQIQTITHMHVSCALIM